MANFYRWQSGTTLLVVCGLLGSTLLPAIAPAPAVAQLFPQTNRVGIPAGTLLPATYSDAERIVLQPDETMPLTLEISQNITNSRGTILIPRGAQITGQLQPARSGIQFVASDLILRNGNPIPLDATSEVITRTETLRRGASTTTLLTGALVGGATATVISAIVTDVGIFKTLGGAGAGVLGGWLLGRRRVEVVVVDPQTDLDLTLNSDLPLN